jgi:hypothetical protein
MCSDVACDNLANRPSALKAKGAELAKADLNDPESYKPALKGADAAFVNADCRSSSSLHPR